MSPDASSAEPAAPVSARTLRTMGRDELDALFRRSPAGPVPQGRTRGTALLFPGTRIDRVVQPLVRLLFWQGKVFRGSAGARSLTNLVGPFPLELFEARVYVDESWFSGGPAVILDYSEGSILVRTIRDEIRLVADGLYLGQIFWGRTRIGLFMLEIPPALPGRGRT